MNLEGNNQFHRLDDDLDNLIENNNLNIESLEKIMLSNLENYKVLMNKHIEEILPKKVNEKGLIIKKTGV